MGHVEDDAMKLTKLALALMEEDAWEDEHDLGQRELVKRWQAEFMGDAEADGIYGPKTAAALWNLHKPGRDDIVERALESCRPATGTWPVVKYSMRANTGMGETYFGEGPFATGDCSDFAAHCMGLSKHHKRKWYGTDGIVSDARGYNQLYEEVERKAAAPGDLVVYPGRYERGERVSIGHVGVIVEVDGERITTVDCASSNRRRFGSAIAMVDKTEVWDRKNALIARPSWLQ